MKQTHFPVEALTIKTCLSACGKRIPDSRTKGVDELQFITCKVCYRAALERLTESLGRTNGNDLPFQVGTR